MKTELYLYKFEGCEGIFTILKKIEIQLKTFAQRTHDSKLHTKFVYNKIFDLVPLDIITELSTAITTSRGVVPSSSSKVFNVSRRWLSSGSHFHSPNDSSFGCKYVRVPEPFDTRPELFAELPNNVVVVVSDAVDSRFVGGFIHNL